MRQKYKILHIETGLYINYFTSCGDYFIYCLSKTPYIFTYKVPYFSMFDRRLNKILKDYIYYPDNALDKCRKMDKCEFEIMEVNDDNQI